MRFEIRNKLVFLCALFSLSWLFFTSSHVTNFSAVYFPFPSIGLFTLAMFCVCVCVCFSSSVFLSFSSYLKPFLYAENFLGACNRNIRSHVQWRQYAYSEREKKNVGMLQVIRTTSSLFHQHWLTSASFLYIEISLLTFSSSKTFRVSFSSHMNGVGFLRVCVCHGLLFMVELIGRLKLAPSRFYKTHSLVFFLLLTTD